ncbi:MAG: 50S ribosomal protein L11 methyltransferase [Anaerolineae bacterium]|nr:50S ribosomal protein L11 methyltransferase [Anaerolineae bacterium]
MESATNRWVEISVEVEREAVDDLLRLFNRHCQGGAVLDERPAHFLTGTPGQILVKGFLPVGDEVTRQKLEVALLLLSRSSPISEPRVRVLEPEDWAEAWKAFFPPQRIGQRTVIVPSWESYAPRPDEIIIHLDPGMAFGTGLHATTRLCLLALEQLHLTGWRVLDVGCGSGILAIAAALQGATCVEAVDVDPVAVQVARDNVARNGISSLVSVSHGTLGDRAPADVPRHAETGYDLLLVNILAEVIMGMAPALARALRSGGQLVGSGIVADKADQVITALEEAGLIIDDQSQEDHWVALMAHRP